MINQLFCICQRAIAAAANTDEGKMFVCPSFSSFTCVINDSVFEVLDVQNIGALSSTNEPQSL